MKSKRNEPSEMYPLIQDAYEIIIASTMSSGKSTFINALIGMDLLPTSNLACTHKIYRIIDIDEQKHFSCKCYNSEDFLIHSSSNCSKNAECG